MLEANLDRAAEVLAQAFKESTLALATPCLRSLTRHHSDIFLAACTGGDQSLNYPYQWAIAGAAFIGGELWIADDGDEVAGIAAWYPPGKALNDSFVLFYAGLERRLNIRLDGNREEQRAVSPADTVSPSSPGSCGAAEHSGR